MAVEMNIVHVRDKLRNLQRSNPRLVRQVSESIDRLTAVEVFLNRRDGTYGGFNPELLEAIYVVEDTIDNFLLRPALQKYNLVFSYLHLKSLYIQFRFTKNFKKLAIALGDETTNIKVRLPKISDAKKISIFYMKGKVKELAELILNRYSSPFHISVVDGAGPGKTTELRKIYDSIEVKNHFECCAWVRVRQGFERKQLLFDILKQVSNIPTTKLEVEKKLCDFLIKKRYLVVLLDVRTPYIWEILKNAFPNSSNGSRVIFSYREVDAARNPDVRFYGREHLLNLENMVPNPVTNVIGDDIGTSGQEDSDDDLDQRLGGVFDEETDIIGLEDKMLELAKLTLKRNSNKYSLISVVGVAGSGKTTLVKTIYNNSYIRQNFDCRAWVNVHGSHDFDKGNVLIDILKQVARDKDEEGLPLDKLESRLIAILYQTRFLIVLDDVHQLGAWYDFERILSPSSQIGSRVILITRDPFVARGFSPIVLHLRPLNEDESWELFLKKVIRGDESNPPDLMNLKIKVWQKCRGLPLTICVLGGLLSGRNLSYSEWSKVIEEIMPGEKKKEREHGKQEDAIVIENAASDEDQSFSPDQSSPDKLGPSYIWNVGYKELSFHLRACLDYLRLFPRSYEIPVRRLFQLWLAERYVRTNEGEGMTPEDQVEKDFVELERRNMIEVARRRSDGRPKTCLVPSTLYDTLFQNAEDMGCFHIHRKSESTSNSQKLCIRRLAEYADIQNNPFSDKYIEYLHSYISFNTRKGDKPAEEVGKFLNKTITKRGFRLLRVLDLEHVYKPVLPETLGKLKLLRYIGLRWTFLDSIPMSIGDLPHLETLDVKHTNITKLPMSIWKTKTLRHLYMNEIHFEMSIWKPFSSYSLVNLQTLWGLFIGNKCPPINWLKSLSRLRNLGLTCHTKSLEEITNWIDGLTSLQSLRLRSINDFGEPSDLMFRSLHKHVNLTELYLLGTFPGEIDISLLPPRLRILTLSVSQLSDDPMPKLGKLKHLKILRLFAHSYIKEQMTCLRGGFPELRVLKLWVLRELKEWTIEKGAIPALEELEIRYCQKLEKLEGLKNVTTLKDLFLTNMEDDFICEVKKNLPKKAVITEKKWNVYPPWD